MSKIISQETFNEVVTENIVEFSMDANEAKDETIKQFEAQGINLANIIKDLSLNEKTGQPLLNESVEKLKSHASETQSLTESDLIENLTILEKECKQSVPHRVMANKIGAYEVILLILEKHIRTDDPEHKVLKKCLLAANALINKQPDIFDPEALLLAMKILNQKTDPTILCDTIRWIAKACVMHERNRQNIMNADILQYLMPLLKRDEATIVKEVCCLFRYLILDDDIRVEFGKAHEHARTIATLLIIDLTKLLEKFKDNEILLPDLVLTIASLTVRNEFCAMVEEAGGLKFVIEIMKHDISSKLAKECFKLLRSLAGNDTVKAHIIQEGAAPLIQHVLELHKDEELLAKIALACISTLTLRSVESSKALFDCGIAESIIDCMKLHATSKAVQRNGAWSIRNMVSRSRYQCDQFIAHDAEEVLNAAIEAHPSIMQDIKSAMRDLGCNITLNEEWTNATPFNIARE